MCQMRRALCRRKNAELDTRNGFNSPYHDRIGRPDGTVGQPRRMPLPKR
ncbi:MAG: hypothetical protein QOD94_3049 [Alphaproteobacteria bacterium]|nr:hypothetical protein [Alphaproteobacteria bacterium]